MTPLDRMLEPYPALKEAIFWTGDHLGLIVGLPFALLFLFILYWTFYLAPRNAKRILGNLKKRGYYPLPPEDSKLKEAIERLTPVMFHPYELSTVDETSPWKIDMAYGSSHGGKDRILAHINRTVKRSPRAKMIWEHEFSVVLLEVGPLAVGGEVHVVGDGYDLDPDYGLRKVEGIESPLSATFDFYTADGKLPSFPPALKEALMECATLLSIKGSKAESSSPYIFHARLKFTSGGWGLVSNEFIYSREKMDALLGAADRLSAALG